MGWGLGLESAPTSRLLGQPNGVSLLLLLLLLLLLVTTAAHFFSDVALAAWDEEPLPHTTVTYIVAEPRGRGGGVNINGLMRLGLWGQKGGVTVWLEQPRCALVPTVE